MLLKRLRAPAAATATLLLASLPALASWDVDILPPASPTAQEAYSLHWGIMYVCIAIFFIVFGAMFWSIFKHRKSVGAKAAQFHENTTIEILWTIIPLVVLIAMAWPATRTMIEMKDASNADMSIKVTGYQWRWDYDYQQDGVHFISNLSTPRDEIDNYHGAGAPKDENYLLEVDRPLVVPAGKKVRLLITSNDVIHGFYVPQLGVHQYGIPGFVKEAWFEVDKPGIYRGQCSQICGKEHAFMPIVVEVKSQDDYAAWLKAEKAKMPSTPPPSTTDQLAPAPASGAPAASQEAATAQATGAPTAGAAAAIAANEPKGNAPAPAAGGKAASANGKQTFDSVCTACHSTGVLGAPKVGDKAAWGPRIAKGKATLYEHALHGFNAMPPKGGNAQLTDDAVKAAVDYMVSQAQ